MFLSTLLVSSLALANSNCNNPRNSFDDLYCLNKVYIQADKELNSNYQALRKLLDAKGRQLLKQSQIRWIHERDEDCSYYDDRGFFVNLNCATNTTIERAHFLADRKRECVSSGCMNSRLSD